MLKIFAILCLAFVVSGVSAGCDSCGSECAHACGTRRFRACCFNYLRKKRGSDDEQDFLLTQDLKESQTKMKPTVYILENIPVPEEWISNMLSNKNHPYYLDNNVENHLY